MEKLYFFSDSLLSGIKRRIPTLIDRYRSNEPWVEAYVQAEKLGNIVESKIEIPGWPNLVAPDGNPVDDATAAVRLHEAFRILKPIHAGDERLWSYLCHVSPLYEYVHARWIAGDKETRDSAIVRRFFFENRGLGGNARNALSRLWWAGYLTCDEGSADPYRYTRMFMQHSDIPTGLLERGIGKSQTIVKQVAVFVATNADKWTDRSHTIQRLLKGVNAAGGAIVLDAISEAHLRAICRRSIQQETATGQ